MFENSIFYISAKEGQYCTEPAGRRIFLSSNYTRK